jgi:hypothetical protein
MTKGERDLLLRGVNPLTGQPINPPIVARPATASPAPAWVTEARAAVAAQPVAPTAELDRAWSFTAVGRSNSGRDTIVFSAPMKNGGTFQATLPGDLVRAIQAHKVAGLK